MMARKLNKWWAEDVAREVKEGIMGKGGGDPAKETAVLRGA